MNALLRELAGGIPDIDHLVRAIVRISGMEQHAAKAAFPEVPS